MTAQIRSDPSLDRVPEEWFDLNYRLQEEALDTNINKAFLDLWIIRLRAMIPPDSKCFGLFIARINELALYCAARYADCCELNAAGELLFGKGDFFQDLIQSSEESRPLIPFLSGLLEDLGYLSEEYIISVHRRIDRIKEVVGMFAERGILSCEEFSKKLSSMDYGKKRQIQSMGCLFNRVIFNDLGRELHLFMGSGGMKSKYLKDTCNTVNISYLIQSNRN